MLKSFLSSLRTSISNDKQPTRRSHPRRSEDRCVAIVYGQTFPVRDWSFGGILLDADERMFGSNQDIDVTIKFKLRNAIIDITPHGRVVRKTRGRVAIKFEPLSQTIRRSLQRVIDEQVAREFAESQAT